MKVVLKDGRRYVLRFDKGEELWGKLTEFMTHESMQACAFWGIGSVSEVELGFYNNFLKEYRKKPFLEELELLSLQGTGASLDGKFILHAHGEFGRTDFSVLGGHVFRLVVSATVEIILIKLEGQLNRRHSEEFNLNLLV